MSANTQQDLTVPKRELTEFQETLVKYINNKLDYMQQEITMLNKRIDILEYKYAAAETRDGHTPG